MRGWLANVPECAVAISFSVFMQQNIYCRLFFLRLVGNIPLNALRLAGISALNKNFV
jgi:hypothetical protein